MGWGTMVLKPDALVDQLWLCVSLAAEQQYCPPGYALVTAVLTGFSVACLHGARWSFIILLKDTFSCIINKLKEVTDAETEMM